MIYLIYQTYECILDRPRCFSKMVLEYVTFRKVRQARSGKKLGPGAHLPDEFRPKIQRCGPNPSSTTSFNFPPSPHLLSFFIHIQHRQNGFHRLRFRRWSHSYASSFVVAVLSAGLTLRSVLENWTKTRSYIVG